jgi:hypothetical protein
MKIFWKSLDALIDDIRRIGLEVNGEKRKYMLKSHHQNSGQHHNMNIANRLFENILILQNDVGFEVLGISGVPEQLLAPQEGLISMEVVVQK